MSSESLTWRFPNLVGPINAFAAITLASIVVWLDHDERKFLQKGKESINITPKNVGLLDVFARKTIIIQVGVLASVFSGALGDPK